MDPLNEQERIFRGIKASLALKGITLADIARDLGRTRQSVRMVAKGMSRRELVRRAIATAIGRDPWDGKRHSRKN